MKRDQVVVYRSLHDSSPHPGQSVAMIECRCCTSAQVEGTIGSQETRAGLGEECQLCFCLYILILRLPMGEL